MKTADHLDKGTRKRLKNLSGNKKKKVKKKKRNVERFTEKDILDLMGTKRDRYERRGGAVRRK